MSIPPFSLLVLLVACLVADSPFIDARIHANSYNGPLSQDIILGSDKPITELDKERILKLVNTLRSRGRQCGSSFNPPARTLVWNFRLERAARLHSMDMYRQNYFEHTSKDGSRLGTRIKRQGYTYFACAENIAFGYQTEEAVMAGWTRSEGHCKNYMNDTYTEIGIARTGNYWVMVLAIPDKFASK
jgi:uncharacterized protein YkwD